MQIFAAGDGAATMTPMDKELVEHTDLQGVLVVGRMERAKDTLASSRLTPHIKALIALPIRSETDFQGILWAGFEDERQFEQTEVNFLSSLANQASFAVANARLFEAAEGGRRQLAAILSSTSDAVLVSDSKGRLLLINPAAEKIFSVKADTVGGRDFAEVISQPQLVELMEDMQNASASTELPQEDGTTLLAHASTIQGNKGDLLGRVVLLSDITYLKELDELKSTFVNAVSHDLRSPLTFIDGYITMLPMVGDLNEKQKDFLVKMRQGISQMTDLIDKLLRLGRMEAGVPLDLEACDVKQLIATCCEAIGEQATSKQIDLTMKIDGKLPLIIADTTLYRQAITNLVENAVKYTSEGGAVTVSASADNGEVTVAVKDTGRGISAQDQRHLFEPFFRIKQSGKNQIKGSGLGLAIVKGTADRHGGRVHVESELAKGSTFYLTGTVAPARKLTAKSGYLLPLKDDKEVYLVYSTA